MSGKAAKDPTRAQLSSRLQYHARVPAFLQKMQNRVAGVTNEDEEEEEEDGYEYDGSGRPPIPKRPAIPKRPEDDPGSAEEDDEKDLPQIVVLKEGKHLSEREVENEKRKARGLSPLPDAVEETEDVAVSSKRAAPTSKAISKPQTQSLSFSSSGSGTKPGAKKRKIVADADGEGHNAKGSSSKPSKKPKKAQKKLLSFGDDA
ncbi:hypothetical protein BC835DRAFT_1410505 [Cytidiella melzeri]|nr:hypothetical protein BC835DRAFT_1410505 [Cytidiella melzeri]